MKQTPRIEPDEIRKQADTNAQASEPKNQTPKDASSRNDDYPFHHELDQNYVHQQLTL